MTRKHLNKLAEELSKVRPAVGSDDYYGWFSAVVAVTEACKAYNPNFDYARFIDACKAFRG